MRKRFSTGELVRPPVGNPEPKDGLVRICKKKVSSVAHCRDTHLGDMSGLYPISRVPGRAFAPRAEVAASEEATQVAAVEPVLKSELQACGGDLVYLNEAERRQIVDMTRAAKARLGCDG